VSVLESPVTSKHVDADPAQLRVEGLTMSYGSKRVLHGVDLEVRSGELVSVLGANGSGKSTMLRCVVGLESSESGRVLVNGEPRTRRPTAVAMVFQKIDLVGRYSALDNVCSGALGRLPLGRSLHPRLFPRALREEAMGCLAEVGLVDRAHDPVRRLSGGQQQRVAVARALCQRPDVLLADEPVSALDPSAAEQVMTVLARVAHSHGLAVLAVLHQPDIARRHSDRLVGFQDGRVVFAGTPDEVDVDRVGALYALRGEHV
jgi:phosphonate transport system ATP-binding protein